MFTMLILFLNELSKNRRKFFNIDFRLKNTLILFIISISIVYIKLRLIDFDSILQCLIISTGVDSIFSYFHLNRLIRIIIEIALTIIIGLLLTSTLFPL